MKNIFLSLVIGLFATDTLAVVNFPVFHTKGISYKGEYVERCGGAFEAKCWVGYIEISEPADLVRLENSVDLSISQKKKDLDRLYIKKNHELLVSEKLKELIRTVIREEIERLKEN